MSKTIARIPIEEPKTFNYAITCACIQLSETPKIHLVDYQASPTDLQKRLPGGKFQASDLLKTLDNILRGKNEHSLINLYMDVDSMQNQYLAESCNVVDFAIANELFNKFTQSLFERTQSACKNLPEEMFNQIIFETHLNTVRSELKDEIGASRVGKLLFSSLKKNGEHAKLGFTSIDVDAPDFYQGSGDPKVLRSYESVIDDYTAKTLFNGHANNFQEGLRCIIENYPDRSKSLKRYWTASK